MVGADEGEEGEGEEEGVEEEETYDEEEEGGEEEDKEVEDENGEEGKAACVAGPEVLTSTPGEEEAAAA